MRWLHRRDECVRDLAVALDDHPEVKGHVALLLSQAHHRQGADDDSSAVHD